MKKKNYRFLLADLDNTLLDFSASEHYALCRTLNDLGVTPDDEVTAAYSSYNDSLWKRLERREITRNELIRTRFTGFFESRGISADGTAAAPLYESYLSRSAVMIDGAEELIGKCRGKVGVYIISNGTARVQLPRLAASKLDKLCDGYFISELVGYSKPDVRFFELTVQKLPGFEKELALVLGDSLSADIAGGIAYGVDTCLYDPRGKYDGTSSIKPDYIVNDLASVIDILAPDRNPDL